MKNRFREEQIIRMHIPVRRSRSSGRMETACPELETAANHFYSLSVLSNP